MSVFIFTIVGVIFIVMSVGAVVIVYCRWYHLYHDDSGHGYD